ncbi:SusC/RagA family TonB-linked outer membrane protein [Flavivirga eckloniae]|uniref:TonB-dependent receptor plug domain-containing protein n=1 Tax=Flavivirga eckloniae TaxID=1803846 RepID=A0A2K9PSC9_9FLAO|nr:SusC/RagA family TonB-linked outer membrane protein [Flavivirga eckloniae]AUP79961.1 hypothetical protein C1H87_15125 [Flavivirga eckloniae]
MEIKLTNLLFYFRKKFLIHLMRAFIFFICTTAFSLAPNNVFSQRVKINIDADKTVTVDEIFKIIKAQTDYRFIYQEDMFKGFPSVNLKRGTIRANKLLQEILPKGNFKFNISGKNTIVIKRKPAIVQQKIQGKVTDENGEPLIGVVVIVKGTLRGATTSFDGIYKIDAQEGETLVLSYLGYLDSEVIIGQGTTYNVQMAPSSFELDTVEIVSTGYQTISKERSTGSFERVNEKTLDLKINQNIFSKIEGEVAGVTTDTDGNFIIRGLSTISANSDPLIVVDGFPIEQNQNTINPNDVESITILKDAAAASIWGIRAANGVIVIVTKKGNRNGKLTINASVNTSITPEPDLFAAPIADAATQVAYQREVFERGGFHDQTNLFNGNLNVASGQVLNPVVQTLLLQDRGDISSEEAQSRLEQLENTDIRREYSRLIQRPEIWTQYNFSINGGSEKYDFRSSISYNDNQKELINTKANQYLINFANSFNISSKLKVSGSINFSQSKESFGSTSVNDDFGRFSGSDSFETPRASSAQNLLSTSINSRILDDNGNYLPMQNFLALNQEASNLALERGFPYDWTYNLKQELDNADNILRETALRLNTGLNYNIIDGLDASVTYQYEWQQQNIRDFHNEQSFYTRFRVNLFTQLDPSTQLPVSNAIPVGAILDIDTRNQRAHTFRTQLNFDKLFNEKHQVTAIAGYEVRKTIAERATSRQYGYDERSLDAKLVDFTTDFTESLPLRFASLIPDFNENVFVENRFISYFANASYTFDNKYTISGSTRLDDTNLFGASDEYRNIPLYSVGAKWNIANEFFTGNQNINRLQLRATYGINGNVDRSTSPQLLITPKNISFPFVNGTNADITGLPNPELRLERTNALNLGLDFGLFGNLISGSVEYYKKDSEDLLAFTSVNPISGVNGARINNGTLRNEGFDINLTLRPLRGDNFRYTTTGNFSVNTNTLIKVDVQSNAQIFDYVNGNLAIPDLPLRTIYSYNYQGLDRNGAPQFLNENNRIVDFRANIFEPDALVEEGSLLPKYYGSWVNNLEYKNFYLRTLTTFKAGHVFRYRNASFIPANRVSPLENVPADYVNRWQNPGDENNTDIPAIPAFQDRGILGYAYYRDSNKFVDDASHIRLSQLSFGYVFPTKTLERLGMNSLQIGFQADNMVVWNFNKWDVDPESAFIPRQATYTLNISASF